MSAIPTLETTRLWLRPYRPADFAAYGAIFADAGFMRFLGGKPLSREAAWARFLRQQGMWVAAGFGFFAIELKATGAFIGEAGCHDLKRDLTPSLEGTLEAGWGIAPAMQGQGLSEEAARAALAWAGAARPELRMTSIIHPENAASLRLAAKLGFIAADRATYHDSPVVILGRPAAST
jgi:RimJ/RimL family protein N-acetyltransferase